MESERGALLFFFVVCVCVCVSFSLFLPFLNISRFSFVTSLSPTMAASGDVCSLFLLVLQHVLSYLLRRLFPLFFFGQRHHRYHRYVDLIFLHGFYQRLSFLCHCTWGERGTGRGRGVAALLKSAKQRNKRSRYDPWYLPTHPDPFWPHLSACL